MNPPKIVCTAAHLGQKWAGIPGIEVSPAGHLFVVWFSGGEKEPDPQNTIYLATSLDRGDTFSTPVILAGPRGGARAFDPTLWLAPTGQLWLIFNRGDKDAARHGVFARICAQPDAPVPQWGEEFRVGYNVPFSFRMNKPTVLSSGEWVMPVTHAAQTCPDWFAGSDQLQGVGISSDEGRSWTLQGAVKAPAWALENMIMQRRDGSLLMFIRTGAGTLWQSISTDHGQTWSEGRPTAIPNPGSRFFIRRLPDGDWLLINSPDPKRRTGIVATLSSDEGATWRGWLVLDDRDNVSYPDAAFAPDAAFPPNAAFASDDVIYAVHDRDRSGVGEILLSRFTRQDF